MAECLVIKAPGVVTDKSLRKIGEFIFKVIPNGDSSGFTRVRGVMSATASMKIAIDNGTIHKTKEDAGTPTLTINGVSTWGVVEFYIKSNGKEGYLHFEDVKHLQLLGKGWNELFATQEDANAPSLKMPLSFDVKAMSGVTSIYASSSLLDGAVEGISMLPSLRVFLCNYDTDLIGNVENIVSPKLTSIEMTQSSVSGDISKLFKNCPLLNSLVIGWDKTVFKGDGTRLTPTKLKLFEYKTYQSNEEENRTFGKLIKSLSLCDYEAGSAVRVAGSELSLNAEEQSALTTLKSKTTVTITNG